MPKELDEKTLIFFDRPSNNVALELAQKTYSSAQKPGEAEDGTPKEIQITVGEEEAVFKVVLAQSYLESDANRIWKTRRLQQLKELLPGDIQTFRSRAGLLSFIKTTGGDNILLRRLEDVLTGEQINSATEISKLLGLSHNERGRLRFIDDNRLRFEKVS